MLSLAVYEAYTPAKGRGRIGELMGKDEAEGKNAEEASKRDVLGNLMVESARQLSGVEKKRKK